MKRLLLTLAVVPLFCLAALSFKSMLGSTSAQNTNNESVVLPLLIPGNNLGIHLRSMSNDGNRIVFESTSNVFGGNGENNFEIYVYDKTTLSVVEITNTQNFNDPSGAQVNVSNVLGVISGDGTRIAFLSNAQSLDPANPNNDGNYEIHIIDWPIGGSPGPIRRITDTGNEFGGDNQRNNFSNSDLAISDDGDTIAFVTNRQVFNAINGFQALTIDNPDHDGEVMVCRVSTGQYTQVTHSDPNARPNPNIPGGNNLRPKLSGDGTVLAWLSDFDYANGNPDQNGEIFVTQVGSGNIRQITHTDSAIGVVGAIVPVLDPNTGLYTIDVGAPINVWAADTKALDASGTNIVFESSYNLDGSNNPNKARQVWVYNSTSNSFRMI
ncbi:MAG: PD40 domain-containing protein, partial [Blastocatellia bacterium]|nr:PD40 domain-containing protein [Blastocatellia bacterium]